MSEMNFFAYKSAAERYARARPYFHPLVIEKIRSFLHLSKPVKRSLDAGCGTGQSTYALKEISEVVIGVDVSDEMLELAKQQPGIEYINAHAEDLSFLESNSFDLITCSMAYHWFDQDRFLPEANRLLRDKGWLIIYNNGFTGKMKENAAFEEWVEQTYVKWYPTPPRNWKPLTPESANDFGFISFHAEKYQNNVQFTLDELSAYLTTQSNVISAVEQGMETIEDVYRWLVSEMQSYFLSEHATFLFDGYIWYLQKGSL
jgi:ubiquinone/menaquinone biosynthesis C-methylase UbiE